MEYRHPNLRLLRLDRGLQLCVQRVSLSSYEDTPALDDGRYNIPTIYLQYTICLIATFKLYCCRLNKTFTNLLRIYNRYSVTLEFTTNQQGETLLKCPKTVLVIVDKPVLQLYLRIGSKVIFRRLNCCEA